MYIKLDKEIEKLLCCSMCKGELTKTSEDFTCNSCGLKFPKKKVQTDTNKEEYVYDFRILRPAYCVPDGMISWQEAQTEYEQYHEDRKKIDSLSVYEKEIESIREIYTEEYDIKGMVLDVGGHQGRTRHFLPSDSTTYVSIDPYLTIFSGIGQQPNLLKAFPSLSEPCNFISAHAEHLPFKPKSFDWVHMRSVVDHFADPYKAFLEAYRCTKDGGKLIVGLTIKEKMKNTAPLSARLSQKIKQDGIASLVSLAFKKLSNMVSFNKSAEPEDDHMFRLTHENLKDLFDRTGWKVVKEHWQKPPFEYVIYACGQKKSPLDNN